ncbi:unnamed protein product [Phytomonas sp. EM1]|nr:unnamed protein product [Phytomonas sp. EM1]|eukprot:CCW62150.1 unnamed protein product [Phytomonas sp. isolate EM1]
MAMRFPGVGGHVESIVYGESTPEGLQTLQKPTTAWEILFYLGIHFSEELLSQSITRDASFTAFVLSMGALKRFTASFFAVRFPDAWTPSSEALRSEVERLGGVAFQQGEWRRASDVGLRELWILLFLELFDASSRVRGWSDEFDRPLWGLGLVDETSNAREPAVMDVKIGFLRYSPHTPKEKVARIDLKEEGSICRKVALRPCGFRRFIHRNLPCSQHTTTEVEELERPLLFVIREDELSALLRCFPSTVVSLTGGKPATGAPRRSHWLCVKDCLDRITEDRRRAMREAIQNLLSFFQETIEGRHLIETMAFVSSSVLFVYDAAGGVETVRVRLIDFARSSYRYLNYDEQTIGFVEGLQNLVKYLSSPVRLREGLIQANGEGDS